MDTCSSRLPWRTSEPLAQKLRTARVALNHGARVSGYLFGAVGVSAVLFALTMWLVPMSRNALAVRLAPFVASATGQEQPDAALSAIAVDDTTTSTASRSASDGTIVSTASAANTPPDAQAHALSAREQAFIASYLSRRYHVAQQPVAALVKVAFSTGHEVGLDPLLLLAVMGIESSFNPYAQSAVGAQGLMQVMPQVHLDKFQSFGGRSATLKPLANIQVGARVLKDCIARGGSLAGGLRLYVGSATKGDGGYGAKVIAERERLRDVALGLKVPTITSSAPTLAVVRSTGGSMRRIHATLNGSSLSAQETQEDDASDRS